MNTFNQIMIRIGLSPILLSNAEWFMSAIDILVVAYALYKIITWVRETRAWSLFKGILVLLIVSLLADFFKLFTIQWIIEKTFNVGVIALIIIFQPELRKALDQLGKGKIFTLFDTSVNVDTKELSEGSIGEIVKSVFILAKSKTGALIVVAQQVALTDLEATGVLIDAAITRPLLLNIFVDKTPLHDGAVIIRENRITAASCIMPLTAEELGSDLGTRHRAAVGVSEVSDAIVIVVSEETGVVSVAREGKLYRHISEKDLKGMLAKNISPAKKKTVLWRGRAK